MIKIKSKMTQEVGVLGDAEWKRAKEIQTLRSPETDGNIYPSHDITSQKT
jgi:hypothetical protein